MTNEQQCTAFEEMMPVRSNAMSLYYELAGINEDVKHGGFAAFDQVCLNTLQRVMQALAASQSSQPVINWLAVQEAIKEYVAGYEMIGEDEYGRDGVYSPTEMERAIIEDAIHGLLADTEFLDALRPIPPEDRQTNKLICTTCNADRFSEDCKDNRMNCGIQGTAQTADKRGPSSDDYLRWAKDITKRGIDYDTEGVEALLREFYARCNAQSANKVKKSHWQPIDTAPTDNKRPLYLARFYGSKLVELDFDGTWDYWQESWELSHINGYAWFSANGIEEPTHWAYQDEVIPISI